MDQSPETIDKERKKAYEAVNKTRTKLGLDPIPFSSDPEPFYCSFCGKQPEEVESMVSGASVYICNECIRKCYELINE